MDEFSPTKPNLIFGFDVIKTKLLDELRKNKLHHALILSGNLGIGKSSFAIDFASKITGSNAAIENNPDILLIQPEENKQNITVDLIRKINDFLALTSAFSQNRVIIIDALDEMNNNARNALLKSLEEPAQNVFFILINHNSSKISSTIKSRCRIIKINNLNFEDFKKALKQEDSSIKDNYIKDLFEIFAGSVGLAINFHKNNGIELYDELLASLQNQSFNLIGKISDKNFSWEIIEQIINLYLITKIKHLSKTGSPLNHLFHSIDQIEKLLLEVKFLNADKKLTLINIINLLKPYELN